MWPSIALLSSLALAEDVASLKACTESAKPKDVAWASARTVRVETGVGSGTGVSVSPDGFLLTAAHVIAGATSVKVVFEDDRTLDAVVVRSSPDSDLALLRVDDRALPCMPIRGTPAAIGSDVLIIGSPGGAALTHSVSKGIVSAYREVEGRTVVQTDASINAGNSGGPLVGETGELIGIVSFKLIGQGVEGLGFAVAATNVPAELQLRWGTKTDDSLLTGKAEPTVSTLSFGSAPPPVLTTGSGGPPRLDMKYSLQYKPQAGAVGWGVVFAATGLATIGWSFGEYRQSQDEMEKARWSTLKWVNATGWTSLALGGWALTVGFAVPSKNAPVIVEAP
jgi:hypothetical protein